MLNKGALQEKRNDGRDVNETLSGYTPADRLDIDSTGVTLFTRVVIVARRLIEPESKIPKEYVVRVQSAVHGEEGEERGRDDGVGGLAGRILPIHCASAMEGEGPYGPASTSAAMCNPRVLRLAGTHPCNGLDGLDGSTARQARQLDSSMVSMA
jgi:hypothetical protein